MSALSVRVSSVQASARTVMETTAIRLRGATTLDSVRRNLFGTVDREESRRFVERELARQLECDSRKWGFDFANDQPLPGAQRFAWQILPATAIPPALRRAPLALPTSKPAQPSPNKTTSPDANKVQKRITDFLKPRKRLATPAGKKSSPGNYNKQEHCVAHLRPSKVPRLAKRS